MTDSNFEEVDNNDTEQDQEKLTCAQCQRTVDPGDEVQTENAVFCRPCFGELKGALEETFAAQSQNINFAGAVSGGLIGSLLGALAWWGFVIATDIQFGLVAILIGWGAGKGVVILSGHKRALSLQLISVATAALGYGMASYWVMRSLILEYITENGLEGSLSFFPEPAVFIDVVGSGFELFDLIFLAIALWQAWKMPAPISMNGSD